MWKVYDKNNLEKYAIRKVEYFGGFMDRKYVTTTIKSSKPIDFQIGDYFTYRGERFTLNYIPSVSKKSTANYTGDAFIYENIVFNSYSDELTRCEFLDYVLHDNIIHFSSLPTFGFYAASVQDLADRVQANLDRIYTGVNKWTVTVHHDFISPVGVFISIDKSNVWDSLSLFKTKFNANFIIRGRSITIGTAGQVIDNVFEYGKGKGLVKIEKISQSDQQIITRLRVYGSTRNIPHRYYNKLSNASLENYLPDNMAVHNLMLPPFPYETLDPFLDSENISELGIMEGSVFFDGSNELLPEIYPSMEGMTAQQLNNAGISVNLDAGDNGNLDELSSGATNTDGTPIDDNGIYNEGESIPSFKISLKDVFGNSDNLADIISDGASISFKSGMCAGREFEIIGCVKEGNKYILTCNRVEDQGINLFFPYGDYPISHGDKFVLLNIEMPEVYIKAASQRLLEAGKEYLSKNDYTRYTYQVKLSSVLMARNPSLGNSLVEGDYLMFTDEDLGVDGSIIIDTLKIKEGEEVMPSYEITLSNEKQVGAIQKIQNRIDMIISGGMGGFSEEQVKSLVNLYGSRLFLSKIKTDTAQEVITFLKGIISKDVSYFADLIASGNISAENIDVADTLKTKILYALVKAELKDVVLKGQLNSETFTSGLLGNGFRLNKVGEDWVLELDRIVIRKAMEVHEIIVQNVKNQGGQVLHSPAGGKITKVTDGGSYWRVEHDSTDSFTTGAQALCQNFKVGSEIENTTGETTFQGISVKRYWRLVTSFGKGWFNLSKTDMEAGSAEPEIGDDVSVLGHRTDVNQQGAIMVASTGGNTPYIAYYSGINSFSLVGKEVVRDGNLSGVVDDVFGQLTGFGTYSKNGYFRGKLAVQSGKLVEELVADSEQVALQAASEAEHKAQQALEDLAAAVSDFENEIEGIQQQMDGMVNSWFFPYSPTLSNYPSSEWITDSLKDAHIGDTFTNTQEYIDDITTPDSGKSWRWVKNDGVYSWNRISDSDAAKALMLASQAQATADGKSTVYLVQPSNYSVGDLWVLNVDRTINGTAYKQGEILTATQDSVNFVESHWLKRVRYTDDTAVNNLQIGTVNILRNSNIVFERPKNSDKNYHLLNYTPSVPLKENGLYTFVCKIKFIPNVPGVSWVAPHFGAYNSIGDMVRFEEMDGVYIFQGINYYNAQYISFYQGDYDNYEALGSYVKIEWAALYEGHVKPPLTWSPNNDDIQYEITRVETKLSFDIDSLQNQITAKVSQTDFNALGSRVSAAESQLTIQSGQIASKVSQIDYDANNSAISSQFSQIIQKANSIELSVSAVDAKVDNLQIGGANKLPDSKTPSFGFYSGETGISRKVLGSEGTGVGDVWYIRNNNTGTNPIKALKVLGTPGAGELVSISFKAMSHKSTPVMFHSNQGAKTTTITNDGEIHYIKWEGIVGDNYGNAQVQIRCDGEFELYIWDLMYEDGNKSTSYRPSQEDIQASIDAIPQNLLATGINIVDKKITITANNTIFQNNAGQQVALFNSNFTKIQASAIELEGLVTVNSRFKVLLDGSIETVNMKAVDGEFTGKISSNYDGNRIVIDAATRSLRFITSNNELATLMDFSDTGGYPKLIMYGSSRITSLSSQTLDMINSLDSSNLVSINTTRFTVQKGDNMLTIGYSSGVLGNLLIDVRGLPTSTAVSGRVYLDSSGYLRVK